MGDITPFQISFDNKVLLPGYYLFFSKLFYTVSVIFCTYYFHILNVTSLDGPPSKNSIFCMEIVEFVLVVEMGASVSYGHISSSFYNFFHAFVVIY